MASKCRVWWNGEEYTIEGGDHADGDFVLAGRILTGMKEGVCPDSFRSQDLCLFTMGGVEVPPAERVYDGAELVLRPRVVH
jgi:hypothetical protein